MAPGLPLARDPAARALGAAALLFAGSLALFWPGYALYDSVAQYRQALSGRFDDWHPPVMAALWRGLWLGFGGGTGPMLAVQLAGWWLGVGLIAAGLAQGGRPRAGASALAVGALPPLLGWQAAVLKDAQMAGALLAAIGLIAWWRLRSRSMPWLARGAVAVLLLYATLVRANAVFAVAPLVAGLLGPMPLARRGALAVALVVAGLAVASPINHGLFEAERTGVERTEAMYDLAGIAARAPGVMPAGEHAAIMAKRCATPYFWDPLGDERRCGEDLARLHDASAGALYAALARAAAAHPLAYARHRLGHLNSTERWLVPVGWPGAAPPRADEPNDVGLVAPGRAAAAFARVAGWLAETPLGWPVAWAVVAATVAAAALRRAAAPGRDLALALAASALGQEASFAAVSIASDLRYHLWPMVATALAAVLIADRRPSRRVALAGGGALLLVIAAGAAARLMLPAPPATYAGMLDGASAAPESF